ncbi:Putative carbon-nitrogen hydrolase, protein amidase [Colletotrichum destructivum]|uniref:Carbon-nitrogen hydrolase, protein amidase n=1 Tax=Colletotrichum destructivum TaxID=34406 RepID=A0AAX4IML3_9PEZI|nr:Putative carbon-nitrogen hydrolase, protein amidase [Colletotrichum destructivum]
MRIGCLQFAPQVGDIDNNLNRADSCLNKANTDNLDILVLPELAFTGYNFKSLQHISHFLEPSGSGITSLWARTTALKYNCNVVVGYPEKVDVSNKWPTGPEFYNSAIIVNGDGETIANYRKSFLYHTDETWALEGGKGFYEGWIPGLGNTSIGICEHGLEVIKSSFQHHRYSLLTFDSPYKFQAPWHAFEFAFHVLEYDSNLVILSMAWMTREDGRMFSRMPNEPDMDTLTYWVTRLEPLIRAEKKEEIIIVFCNRTGIEDDAVYAGTSAVIGIQDGEVKVYGLLGRGERELLVIDTDNPPYGKLVYRPESEKPPTTSSELLQLGGFLSPVVSSGPVASSRNDDSRQGVSLAISTQPQPASLPKRSSSVLGSSQKSSKRLPALGQTKLLPAVQMPTGTPLGSNSNDDTASSPESIYISTPTAPSPTPQAIRPKLTIPLSTPLQPWQTGSPVHHSYQSTRSAHSLGSSDSTQLDPRPPEDSTPYPHSGVPRSTYPRKGPEGLEKRIYSGSVSITHLPVRPITPFNDHSPTEAGYVWQPSDLLLKTPLESQERNPVAESDETRTQTFHLPLFAKDEPTIPPPPPPPPPTPPPSPPDAFLNLCSYSSHGWQLMVEEDG